MKKIIKSSVLLLAVCFFAGKVNAQLSSEKPAMTAQQTADLLKARSAKSTPAATVPVASQSPAPATTVRTAIVAPADAKTTEATASGAAVKLPAVSDQGGVKPVTSETPSAKPASEEPAPSKPAEVKLPAVPMQTKTGS